LETRGAGKAALRERAAEELAGELLLPFDADADSEARRGSSHSASSTASGGLGVDVVALAGYLKLIPPPLVRAFPRRMLNIHPALLPGPFGGKGFYGIKVHEAVLASGARFSGPTVHFVDEVFDRGPILAQRAVPVLYPKDDAAALAKRVLAAEHEVFPEALGALCSGRVRWTERGIPYY
jgi:phosphoribosylglycinamide formyltransferase